MSTASDLETLLFGRRSVRAYLDRPVPRQTLERLARAARSAPSGANLQPGSLHILTGAALTALSDTITAFAASGTPMADEYTYFPKPMPAHLKTRQREAGYALYSALGIDRRDLEGRRDQFLRNYRFFDAPVGIVVTIDRDMGSGCFMDLGMFLMAFLMAAHDAGLGATGIGALANYGPEVAAHLDLPADQMVVCGIAVGYADPDHPANTVRTTREPLDVFTRFYGFD